LNEKAGVFVSIYVGKKLRGCIGSFAKERTLNELVQKNAASASCDARFKAIKEDELDKMELEISVLSPMTEIKKTDEIELGKHGIFIRRGSDSGTLLPQVAVKTGWDVEQFLGHCARDKAGIGWEGWKTAEIFTYEAVVFRG
jgi:AmmeMemoRadiSam system protein A